MNGLADTPKRRPVVLAAGYRPGAIADLIRLHMDYYTPAWGLNRAFETALARDAGAFFERFDPASDHFGYALDDAGRVVGTVAVEGADRFGAGARLRWFVVDAALHGQGVGSRLLEGALAFCDERAMTRIWLTTFPGLDAARRLYEAHGFTLAGQTVRDPWGGSLGEQTFVRETARA